MQMYVVRENGGQRTLVFSRARGVSVGEDLERREATDTIPLCDLPIPVEHTGVSGSHLLLNRPSWKREHLHRFGL
eukprot:1188729-Rhodomonas_salina.2